MPFLKTISKIRRHAIGCVVKVRPRLLWAGALALLLGCSMPCQAQPPLRIAFPEFPPFHQIDDRGAVRGFFYEIITEALDKRMGIATVWRAYPWPRCQNNVKAGKDDAILTVPTAERLAYTVTHQHPFYKKPLHVFTYADHPQLAKIKAITTLSDIQAGGFSIITYIGNGWHQEHVQPLDIKTIESPYLKNIWKMLSSHRGDIVIEWPPGAWPDIFKLGLEDKIIDSGITLTTMPFHLLIRKNAPQASILAAFDGTLSEMIADGTMRSILARYRIQ